MAKSPEVRGTPPFREGRFTPDALLADNRSPQAQVYLTNWQADFRAGNLAVVWGCSDSRLVLPPKGIAQVRSVAATALPGFLGTVPGDVNIIMNHLDCGGRKVKAAQVAEGPNPDRVYSSGFVDRLVYSPEADYSGEASGLQVASVTRRPTLIVTQDHSTGALEPVTALIPQTMIGEPGMDIYNGREFVDAVTAVLKTGSYDSEGREPIIHEALSPVIAPFEPFLARYREETSVITKPDAGLIDPTTVLVTTEFAGLQRFPNTLGAKRNTVFTVTVPPIQPDGSNADGHIDDPFDQIHYPIEHAIQGQGDPAQPFARLADGGTLLLETNNARQLIFMVNEIYERPYIQQWRQNPNNNIYCLLTTDGAVQGIVTPEDVNEFFSPRQ